MTTTMKKMTRLAALVATTVWLGGATAGQEGPTPEPVPHPPLLQGDPPQDHPQEQEQMEELRQLFLDVEANLERIDDHLADAGAGEVPLDAVENAGIDDLLRQTGQLSLDAQSKIDRILEIAKEMGQGSGSGGGSPPPGGESPLDQPRDQGPTQSEKTPTAPQEKPGGEQEGEEPKDGKKPKDSSKQNPKDGENAPGEPQPNPPGAPAQHGDEADQWGFLPDHVREVFRNQGRDDLPVQYRDWIDAYYRRLNKTGR
jgi:hypothetical protein